MEYRLNKIDPEVRNKVNEATSAGKIHTKSDIVINKDRKKSKEDNDAEFEEELKKQKKENKKILVEAVKVEEVEILAFKEADNLAKDEKKRHFLDVRK